MKTTIKKRAFVSAIAMLIVSAIVLTSSTFAWFSMSKSASVEAMNLTVSSPEGIQISANASAWTASLTVDEIFDTDSTTTSRYDAYEGNRNLYPADLIPVSSSFRYADSTYGSVNFFKATLDDTAKATVTAVDQSSKEGQNNAGLVAFDLFFKVAEATTVYFGTSTFEDTSGTLITSALRLAFSPLGNGAMSTDAATAQGWNGFSRSTCIYYEVDSLTRSADATTLGIAAGKQTTNAIYSIDASGATATNGIIAKNVESIACPTVDDQANASAKSFSLAAGVTKLRVYLWVEGQDVDCLNSVSGAALTANLKFTID